MLKKQSHSILTILKSDMLVQRVDSFWEIVDRPLIAGMSFKDVHLTTKKVRERERGVGGKVLEQTRAKFAME